MTIRLLAPLAVVCAVVAVWAIPGRSQQRAPARLALSCDEVIQNTSFPYRSGRYRPVLAALSVPPAYLPQVVETRQRRWSHWSKSGMVVRAGVGPVTVSVPAAWRDRLAIVWGNAGGPYTTVVFPRCGGPTTVGHAYAGGFYLRAPSACVPLLVRIGTRSQLVRFGLARRCP